MTVSVKKQLDNAVCHGHFIQNAVLIIKVRRRKEQCAAAAARFQLPFQLSVGAEIARPSLKGLSVRHGVHAAAADVHNFIPPDNGTSGNGKKILCRQCFQHLMHGVCTINLRTGLAAQHRVPPLAVNGKNFVRSNLMALPKALYLLYKNTPPCFIGIYCTKSLLEMQG